MPVGFPKIAVLLAAYNGMQWIEEQLDSILNQVGVAITVFISIDPSTDGTEAWCAAYAGAHPNVIVLPEAGRFGGAAPNFFRLIRDVDVEGYDFIAFSDQDDIWQQEKLQKAIVAIHGKDVDVYSSNVLAFWPNGKTHLLDKAQPQVDWDFLFEAAGPGCTYVLSNRLVCPLKTAVLANWEPLQAVTLHDWYVYAFARSQGFRWYIDPVPSMKYRQHQNNQMGANRGLSPLLARYKTIHDGRWFDQVRLIALLIGQADSPFVKSWVQLKRRQLMVLSFKASGCRRRLRDKVLFFFVCWVTALSGKKS